MTPKVESDFQAISSARTSQIDNIAKSVNRINDVIRTATLIRLNDCIFLVINYSTQSIVHSLY